MLGIHGMAIGRDDMRTWMGRPCSFRVISLAHDRRGTGASSPLLRRRPAPCFVGETGFGMNQRSPAHWTGRTWKPGRGPLVGGIKCAEGIHGVPKMLRGIVGNGLAWPQVIGTQASTVESKSWGRRSGKNLRQNNCLLAWALRMYVWESLYV